MSAARRGRPPGRTYGQTKTILFDAGDSERLRRLAELKRTSEAAVVRQLVQKAADEEGIVVEVKASAKRLRRPRNTTAGELKKAGVTLVEENPGFWLECDECGGRWSPNFPPNGQRFARGYWKCPHNGCNEDAE